MFIGREKELKEIRETIKSPGKTVMVYGKRKVGKTALIREALSEVTTPAVYYECVKGTLSENMHGLIQALSAMDILPEGMQFRTLDSLFAYLNSLNTRLIIVIDEYPYLKYREDPSYIDSVFQRVIDSSLSNLNLILSGSHISMMIDLLEEKNALYGRFDRVIRLRELNYLQASQFYDEKTSYDKIAFYSIFGGSPYVNRQIDPNGSLKENIVNTVLNESSPVHLYASNLLMSDLTDRQGMNAERIFAALANGRKSYRELESTLHMVKNGNLSKQLKVLMEMDLISRRFPINRPNDDKKAMYEINDNLLRFYYSYVYKNSGLLTMFGEDAFYDRFIAPSVTTFVSYRFEDLCKNYFALKVQSGALIDVRNIGTYYYDDPVNHRNGEFDVVMEADSGYYAAEVKYLKNPMSRQMIYEEAAKIRDIKDFTVTGIIFISASGFEDQPEGFMYLSADDLYGPSTARAK